MTQGAPARRMMMAAPAFALALASLAAAVVLGAGPRSPHEIAAVFPPWWTSARTFAAAQRAGAVTAFGSVNAVVIVVSDEEMLAQRLYAEGALLLLDPVATGLCGPRKEAKNV